MMKGELYLVQKSGSQDPRKRRVFVVVSRQAVVDSLFSTVICAPVYSCHDGLATQVLIGVAEGLKHDSSIHCDELISLPKVYLTRYVGSLKPTLMRQLNNALAIALALDDSVLTEQAAARLPS